jgi:dihydrofolate reductase
VGRLIYSAITSIDGYVEDASGAFDWSAPDAEVHAFVNDRERAVGTHLIGRRMFETMKVWDDLSNFTDRSPEVVDFAAVWQAADKVVYSTTLEAATTGRTRLHRSFDPDEVAAMVRASDRDVSIGGAALAAQAFDAGIVDEVQLYLNPIAVGGGKPALPGGVRLALLDERRFTGGVVYVRYAVRR